MQTRKYPRTMQEAFGPYTDNSIAEDRPLDYQDVIVIFGGAVAFIFVMALLFWEQFL